ncbi:BolA family transcriptional regulator [Roseomonas sp. NAR14]|uniref:BolA family transcriptional regulator n=1 Tax=Roseomonas acroporae TaxID=2937791 RepID=A0A9X2BXY7_9PROT|nr:BolA family protein [Roseomonas acroporae]MCK8785445.1 BolA family transcriptional regulator [Roseomonas acroporae]
MPAEAVTADGETRAGRIRTALAAAFAPAEISLVDDSARHAGHAGVRHAARGPAAAGETHYTVQVVSPAFDGQTRVARSRAVHAALEREFGSGLHALSLRLLTPAEAARRG